MIGRRVAAALAVALLAVTTSCGEPSVEQSQEDMAQMRERVVTEIASVHDALTAAGFTASRPSGQYRACGMPPSESYEYGAGLGVEGVDDLESGVAEIAGLLEDDGWEPESQGAGARAYANLTRGELRLNVVTSRRTPGNLTVSVSHACVEASGETSQELPLNQREEL